MQTTYIPLISHVYDQLFQNLYRQLVAQGRSALDDQRHGAPHNVMVAQLHDHLHAHDDDRVRALARNHHPLE